MRILVGRPFGCALVLAFLATTSGPAARAREHRPCEMIEYCVDVGYPFAVPGTWFPHRHFFDRALFLLAHCPDQLLDYSRPLDETLERWLEELAEVSFTGDEARRSAIEPFRAALVSDLRRRGDAPPLGRILERLEAIRYETIAGETSADGRDPRPDGTGRPSPGEEIPPERRGEGPEGSWRCGAFSTLVLEELIEDWRRRDGAWFFCFSDQFLFHLAACPDDFFSVMGAHEDEFATWLEVLDAGSFLIANKDYVEKREKTRLAFIAFLSELDPGANRHLRDRLRCRLEEIRVEGPR